MVYVRTASGRGKLRLRSALLLSTAAGFAAAGQAQAQSYQDTGSGDKTYAAAAAAGTPKAVLVTSTNGTVSIDLGTVTATSVAGDTGNVVQAGTAGDKALTVKVGSLTATGGGAIKGIYTSAGTGLTTIDAGTVDLQGRAGVSASSAGNVAINAQKVVVRGADDGEDIDGIAAGREASRVGGDATINAGSVEARGSRSANAIHADAIGNINVTAGALLSDGDGVNVSSDAGNVTIALNGDVDVADGAVSTDGKQVSITVGQGVTVRAGGGAIEAEDSEAVTIVNNGTVIATGANGETHQGAILADASGAVTITSNVATSNANADNYDDGATIRGLSQTGDVNITTQVTTTNGLDMIGVRGRSDTGNVTINAGTTLNVATGGANGGEGVLGSSGTGNVTIKSDRSEVAGLYSSAVIASTNSGNVTITSNVAKSTNQSGGAAIYGRSGTGDVSITTTGDTSAPGDAAIAGFGRDISVTTAANTALSAGIRGISVVATRDVTIDNGAAISVSGRPSSNPNAHIDGIDANAGRDITITTGNIAITSNIAAAQALSAGIRAISNNGVAGGGTITINSAATEVNGANRFAIRALTTGDVAISTSGNTSSAAGAAIVANGNNVTVKTGAGTTTSAGAATNGNAITAAASGNSAVNNGGKVASGALGILAVANHGGNVSVLSDAIDIVGTTPLPNGVRGGAILAVALNGDGNVAVSSQTAAVTGQGRSGIVASAVGSGTVTINSGALSKDANDLAGIQARTDTGAISITSGTLTNGGIGAKGIDAVSRSGGDITISSGTVLNTATGSSSNTAEGIYADTHGAVTIHSGSSEVHGYGASGIAVVAGKAVDISSDSIVTHGDDSTALYLGTLSGTVTVNSGTITTSGDYASGIGINNDDGTVSITSGTIKTSGISGYGIYGYASGDVTVASQSISALGQSAYGIRANSDNGAINVTSKDLAAARYGVIGQSTNGNVTIALTGNTTIGSAGQPFGTAARGIGNDVSISTAAGTVTSAGDTGLDAIAAHKATIVNAGTVTVNDPYAVGIWASGTDGVNITSNIVNVAGVGADPGVNSGTGFRAAQGGIVAEGGAGSITINSNTLNVAGDYRYGIYAHGTGAIDVTSGVLNYAAADSAGIMVLGGAGKATVKSGTLTASGSSGTGIVVRTNAGDIAIDADQTHLSGTGSTGATTADAVVGISNTGAVSIVSKDASTDGWAGSAIAGLGASVTIDSAKASATGDKGSIVYASAKNGDATIRSGTVTTTGKDTQAIVARATGVSTVVSGNITALGTGSIGIDARGTGGTNVTTGNVAAAADAVFVRSAGAATVTVDGVVSSVAGAGVNVSSGNSSVTIAKGGSVNGSGVGIIATGPTVTIDNSGSVAAASGAAIFANGVTHLINAGTITAGTGAPAVVLGAANDLVTLRSGSIVNGTIDTGAGADTVELNGANGGALAKFVNAEMLDVAVGSWTAGTANNQFNAVGIRKGAELRVDLTADGDAGIETPVVANNGTLTINYANTAKPAEIEGVAIGGTGDIKLVGAGELIVADNSVAHTGSTIVENGKLTLTGSLASAVLTSGKGVFQLGDGGTSGTFAGKLIDDGTFIFNRSDNYTIAGDFSGTGSLVKQGQGVLTFGGLYAFTGVTTINGGSVRLTGQLEPDAQIDLNNGTLDLSAIQGGQQTIGELSGGNGGTVALGSSKLTIDQDTNTSFSGTITGTGGLVKDGDGTLNLTGTSTYTGATQVNGGTLKVNGALPNSTVMVGTGGTIGGNGTVGGLQASGGTISPGNSIGHLTVNGNVTFTAATTYSVEVNPAGQADRIDATGTAKLGGAKLQVLAQSGRYRGLTSYTILTAAGGVSGTFGTVTSNFAFLTPSVSYGANVVTLNLARNDASFASLGRSPNERAVGAALQSFGGGNALFEETLLLQDTSVSPNFASLSGELYAGISSGLIENAQAVRRSMLTTAGASEPGNRGWATVIGDWSVADATAGNARLKTGEQGLLGGVSLAGQGFRGSLGAGMLTSEFNGIGHARGQSVLVLGSFGYTGGGFTGTVGGSYAWNDFDTSRTAVLGSISNGLTGAFKGQTWQLFGEASYAVPLGPVTIDPFVGISHVENHSDAVNEFGGALALKVAANKRKVTFTDVGLRIDGAAGWEVGGSARIAPTASAAWRHGWGDRNTALSASFAGSATAFPVFGPVIARNAAELGAGLELRAGNVRVSAGYSGSISNNWTNHAGQVKFAIDF